MNRRTSVTVAVFVAADAAIVTVGAGVPGVGTAVLALGITNGAV
jgi:hypothetical protein